MSTCSPRARTTSFCYTVHQSQIHKFGQQTPWDNLWAYAFPPQSLITQVIANISHASQCSMILIAPRWPQQPWFADLLHLLVNHPRKLPLWRTQLEQPHLDRFHRNPGMFSLHAWKLSSQPSERKAFLERLPEEYLNPLENPQQSYTRLSGHNSVIGRVHSRLIHSKPLFQ